MAYADEVLADSPFGYWKCDETVGTTLADSSGNGRTASLNGSYTLDQSGPVGGVKAVNFSNSSGSYAESSFTSWTSSALTVEYWTRAVGVGDYYPQIGLSTWNGWGGRFWSHGESGDLVFAGTGASTGWSRIQVNNGYNTVGNWHHVVFTCDASLNVNWYKNGVALVSTNLGGFGIGSAATYARFGHNADFCHVAVYPTALSQARVLAHYEQFFPSVRSKPWQRQKRPVFFGSLNAGVRG